jgi:hypothetical protein
MVSRAGWLAGVDGVLPVPFPPRRVPRGIPSTVASPDRAVARGQPSTLPRPILLSSAPGPPGGKPFGRSGGCHALTRRHPRDLPARRGHALVLRHKGTVAVPAGAIAGRAGTGRQAARPVRRLAPGVRRSAGSGAARRRLDDERGQLGRRRSFGAVDVSVDGESLVM